MSRNEIKVNEKKSDAEVENHFLKTQHWAKENDLECDRLRVCKYIKELESSFKDVLIELEQEKTGSLTIAREDFRISYNELSSYSEKKLKTWNKQIESLIKDDITFLERKNDSQIKDLKIAHDQVSGIKGVQNLYFPTTKEDNQQFFSLNHVVIITRNYDIICL